MGFITRQLLTSSERDRRFDPVKVEFHASPSDSRGPWEEKNEVVCRVEARERFDLSEHRRHYLYFTEADLQAVLPELLAAMSTDSQDTVIAGIVASRDDVQLLDLASRILGKRSKRTAKGDRPAESPGTGS
jgi:hypothetical protein